MGGMAYPVRYDVRRPPRYSRLQLAARVLAMLALGVLHLSAGAVFVFAFLVLPVYATARLQALGDGGRYVDEDGPGVLRALRWFAALSAWLGLVGERLPSRAPDEVISLRVEGRAQPGAVDALMRALLGLPSALVLFVLAWVGALVWLWAAVSVLLWEQVPVPAFNYLLGLQRWGMRLLVYQASLVDDYPPFEIYEPSGPGSDGDEDEDQTQVEDQARAEDQRQAQAGSAGEAIADAEVVVVPAPTPAVDGGASAESEPAVEAEAGAAPGDGAVAAASAAATGPSAAAESTSSSDAPRDGSAGTDDAADDASGASGETKPAS